MGKSIHGLAELSSEAATFVRALSARSDHAILVTLSGELGAGKTAFVQEVGRAFGVTGALTSPTFVLLKNYPLPGNASFSTLVHIDAYRLKSGAELAGIDFNRYYSDPKNIMLLEWPERVSDALPKPDQSIILSVVDENSRTLSYA